jgi:hypothetical protein
MVELTAGMQGAKDRLDGGPFGFWMDVHRYATAIVDNGHTTVLLDPERDCSTEPVQGLVHSIVERLPDEMMEAAHVRGSDVHGRPFADRLKAFKNGNILCGICCSQDNLLTDETKPGTRGGQGEKKNPHANKNSLRLTPDGSTFGCRL